MELAAESERERPELKPGLREGAQSFPRMVWRGALTEETGTLRKRIAKKIAPTGARIRGPTEGNVCWREKGNRFK